MINAMCYDALGRSNGETDLVIEAMTCVPKEGIWKYHMGVEGTCHGFITFVELLGNNLLHSTPHP